MSPRRLSPRIDRPLATHLLEIFPLHDYLTRLRATHRRRRSGRRLLHPLSLAGQFSKRSGASVIAGT
jgi:hypothetical protein